MDEIKVLLLKLRHLLYSRGRNDDEADDLIQEAFLRLQEYSERDTVKHAEAFLVRTALNLSVDLNRHRRVAAIVPNGLESVRLVDPAPTPDVALAGQERLRRFERGLRALSPRQREVFLMHRVDGCSYPQIARQLGISVSMTEKHAAKAMLFLADWMKREESHGAAATLPKESGPLEL